MRFAHFIVAILAVTMGATAFEVEAFASQDCEKHDYQNKPRRNPRQTINIWDNTCGTWMHGYKSVRVKTLGGKDQIAHFCWHKELGCTSTCDHYRAVSLS
ncbi:hypothetical protein F5X68DRAFT_241798 [Plectosphaerella plurivora]|uniref:Uncharacterized protein n=1 Tax=Plectosphaerella plurivora TaxID=936078 RepID=A0A9P9A714_9PEZI|nr:hypothetical protein F5X68DRAFT_241798 [Plectosphaerella plurivora]